ncbi:hypothetical protein E5M00_21450 [Escherichia coli]|nr:hypothetical protein E5M00_21450 [Escherichia coli]
MATCKLQMTIFVILHNELVLLFGSGTSGGEIHDGRQRNATARASGFVADPREFGKSFARKASMCSNPVASASSICHRRRQ